MKLEKAFSEDIQQNITAQKADTQYKHKVITSKFNFQCPDENCHAPVTCANLDKPIEQRKRDPYYKIVGEHSPQCELAKDINAKRKQMGREFDIYSDNDEPIEHSIRLNLRPPSTQRPESVASFYDVNGAKNKVQSENSTHSGKRKIQRSKTLPSLIDAYLEKEQIMVQLPEIGVIHINDLFVPMGGQNLSEFGDDFRIYFGKAWFNKKEHGYSIVFDKTLTADELTKRPSTYIPLEKLKTSGFRRFHLNTLEKISDNKPKMVYLLCETGPRVNKEYINFWCENLAYLDYRL